jgi:pimeloyl-ACP methyl ester carboxylesterase
VTLKLHTRRFGHGATPLLMIHCGLGQSAMWGAVARHLADGFSIKAPDLPSHGRSPDADPGWDVHDQCYEALVPYLRDGLHIAGHSFGGTLALRLAMAFPRQVARLTLIEPVLFCVAKDPQIRAAHDAFEAGILATSDSDPLATARAFNRLWGGGVRWDDLTAEQQAQMARRMPFVADSVRTLWGHRDDIFRPADFALVTCPVALIRGTASPPITREIHRGLAERLAAVSETVIDGAAHMLVLSQLPEVAAVIGGRS